MDPSPTSGEGGARCRRQWEGEGLSVLRARAAAMRKNPTDAERKLWTMVRDRRLASFKFRRQVVLAPYISDFVCFERRLILEADGSQHFENAYDVRRDDWLRGQQFEVLRFWNNDVLTNASGVFDVIAAYFKGPHPPTASRRVPPSPARGEGLEPN